MFLVSATKEPGHVHVYWFSAHSPMDKHSIYDSKMEKQEDEKDQLLARLTTNA